MPVDQDGVELVLALEQIAYDPDEVAAHGAADAAAVHIEDFLVGIGDMSMPNSLTITAYRRPWVSLSIQLSSAALRAEIAG